MNYSDTMTKASLDSTVVEDMNQVLAEKAAETVYGSAFRIFPNTRSDQH